jgi:predicted dehydrogenase
MITSCVLIGLGQIGMGYDYHIEANTPVFTHARALAMNSAFRLIGAVDVSVSKRLNFTARYCAPAFAEVEDAMKELSPDLIVIATSSETHNTILNRALSVWNPKLILCEKPLAYNINEAMNIVKICEKKKIDLFVNYMRRTDPAVEKIKTRIDNGTIEMPIKAIGWYTKGIINNGSHIINLLEFWLGEFLNLQVLEQGRDLSENDSEPDVLLRFKKGSAILQAAWEESYSHYTIELVTPSGRLRYEYGGQLVEWQGIKNDQSFNGYKILESDSEVIQNDFLNYQLNVYKNIENHLNGILTNLCTGRQALNTHKIINSISTKKNL